MIVRNPRAGERIRTADLPLTRRTLCLLSYTGRLLVMLAETAPLRSRTGRSTRPRRRSATPSASWYARSVRVRFTARATGSRASAPADAFHAPTVTPALRRAGTTTPVAPNAADDRTTAPRLRGSVTPSRATMRGGVGPVRSEKSCQTSAEW